jgi:TnsA endonuclease-like protein
MQGAIPSGQAMPVGALPSSTCAVADLYIPARMSTEARGVLTLRPGWARKWTASWRLSGTLVVCPVQDLSSIRVVNAEPVRRFTWRADQRHRPGLQFLISTGRHHGFESLAEQQLLLALDFAGEVIDVLSQPFRLRFAASGGWREHIPDFLVIARGSRWLVDVRPVDRIGPDDLVRFAAADEVALAAGWRYGVVTGWRPHVLTTLDTLASRRRPLDDPLGTQPELLEAAAHGPLPFADLVAATSYPAVARAHALHLIWRRSLAMDLARPLGDRAPIWPVHAGGDR